MARFGSQGAVGTDRSRRTSKIAWVAGWLAGAGMLAFLLAPLLAYLHALPPLAGLMVFLAGGAAAMLGALLGIAGVVQGVRHDLGRRPAWLAMLAGLVAGATLLVLSPERGTPSINDITTDTRSPPRFEHAAQLEANRGRDMGYPQRFAALQREAYPHVQSLHVRRSKAQAFRRSVETAKAMGWTITAKDVSRGHLEATATTPVFHFVDDVVVRVQGSEHVASIDVRSASRVGKSDLGVNAARIREFLSRVRR